jgi:hypothetical protein
MATFSSTRNLTRPDAPFVRLPRGQSRVDGPRNTQDIHRPALGSISGNCPPPRPPKPPLDHCYHIMHADARALHDGLPGAHPALCTM